MPNWVYNDLTIKKEDRAFVLDAEGNPDFNILCPMAQSLCDTISPVRKDAIYLYLSEKCTKGVHHTLIEKHDIRPEDVKAARELLEETEPQFSNLGSWSDRKKIPHEEYVEEYYTIGKNYVENLENYGSYTWYDWANRNWGTKWNACDGYAEEVGDYLHIHFDTAWCYPDGWLFALSKKCHFHLAWEEEQGYRGIVYNDEDGLHETSLPMLEWEEDEDGDCVQSEDEYGDDWINLDIDCVFPDYPKGE